MALSLATFRARFPEFHQVPDTAAQACLDEAEATVDREVMDASSTHPKGNTVVGYRAAAALRRMQGEHAVGGVDSHKAYDETAARLARGAASAYRVIGGGS